MTSSIELGFWHVLKRYAIPSDTVNFSYDSAECFETTPYDNIYNRYFNLIFNKIVYLYEYSLDIEDEKSVLQIPVASETGTLALVDGILLKGKSYVNEFIQASDLEAAVMLKNDDIPQVTYRCNNTYD